MSGERYTLPGYGTIKPYRQGDLSNMCGVYAIINALRLVIPERADDRALWIKVYNFAVANLAQNRKLKQGLMQGLTFDAWKLLQHAVYDELSERIGVPLHMRPVLRRAPQPGRDVGSVINRALDARRVVLCALAGTHNHFTVIAGYTPSRWLLFDSFNLRWVQRAATVIGPPGRTPHHIPLSALVMLRRADGEP